MLAPAVILFQYLIPYKLQGAVTQEFWGVEFILALPRTPQSGFWV